MNSEEGSEDQDPGSDAGTRLPRQAGFLLSQLGFHGAARLARRLRPLGIDPRHYGLLSHLAVAEGQSQQQLADAMGIHRNQMVGLLDDLEARGLIERRRHQADRRAHAIHLVPAARELLAEAQQAAEEYEAELLAPLDGPERETLIALLRCLADHAGLPPGVHPGLRRPQTPRQHHESP
jgi:DNA-binding MarR family transcriptional regulator